MAFNFNWSPLTADASFYTRAQELLTTALNKSPKPPIIVDDILVNELNLGSVPPDLEILEIGDLAEDRFRGIFKMCYAGDAFLTLKTRVQANPLNTYLSTKPSFASPQPLAAASGLTIPLQITLSDIKLSAFIILVFSRQKGLTLVFRNDPLESLKVSSTFDSIPFVRDYLQNEIEAQLRTLLMDEVPAIIHRLSLRLWVPEYGAREDGEIARGDENLASREKVINPLASPPQDPVDPSGNVLDAAQIASLSLDSSSDAHSLFSQKNLLRLEALTDSHRTLSLFTPGIRDAVFRAWAGPTERGEAHGSTSPATPMTPGISRAHSYNGSTSTTYTFCDGPDSGVHTTRPTLSSYGSAAAGLSLGAGRHGKPHTGRKRKHRVVNLRKRQSGSDDTASISGESTTAATTSSAVSEAAISCAVADDELITPPHSPQHKVRFRNSQDSIDLGDTPPRLRNLTPRLEPLTAIPIPTNPSPTIPAPPPVPRQQHASSPPARPKLRSPPSIPASAYPREKPPQPSTATSAFSSPSQPLGAPPFHYVETPSGGILEQAWLMKMAGEMARRAQEAKEKAMDGGGGFWERRNGDGERAGEGEAEPPPAYGV
ncbi:MAG: putative Mitochondrial distribution and morphology 34 [Lasallia pustulata]|uniref:Mitochondrial distribution and morphology protein 34 n=1 Tax=Lasallia pustulata TaxID=136370 RepID=A0A5M8PPX1_9LECA|nr:MAG: putative Mitochondrial distribution and morphology 34 [Lasallia pustulata]